MDAQIFFRLFSETLTRYWNFFQSCYVVQGVSLFDFLVALVILTIVIGSILFRVAR